MVKSVVDEPPTWILVLFLATVPLVMFAGTRRDRLGNFQYVAVVALGLSVFASTTSNAWAWPISVVILAVVFSVAAIIAAFTPKPVGRRRANREVE